jgi:hypothetical protein
MGSSSRLDLQDGSFIDWQIKPIRPDRWRPHGVRYRLAWIQDNECRVLFDNHHGKQDHMHIDGQEKNYEFKSVDKLWDDFLAEVRRLGGFV